MIGDNNNQGYSAEEAYFFKVNQELIERKRKELDAKKLVKDDKNAAYWMVCPKCGNPLAEIDLMKIKVDKCTGCHGIYFDSGELQILLESKEPKGFLSGMKKLLSKSAS